VNYYRNVTDLVTGEKYGMLLGKFYPIECITRRNHNITTGKE